MKNTNTNEIEITKRTIEFLENQKFDKIGSEYHFIDDLQRSYEKRLEALEEVES